MSVASDLRNEPPCIPSTVSASIPEPLPSLPASQTVFPPLCKAPPFDCKFRVKLAKSESLAACTATLYPPVSFNEATYK